MSEWRDISTAPKKGSVFWAWQSHVQFACCWKLDEQAFVSRGYGVWAFRGNGKIDKVSPTHWMPLPPPPEPTP